MTTNQEIYGHTSEQACVWSKQTGEEMDSSFQRSNHTSHRKYILNT